MSQPIVDWIQTYIDLKAQTAEPQSLFLFPSTVNPSEPLSPSEWTRLVKAIWKRHSGVPLCPKVPSSLNCPIIPALLTHTST